MLLLCALLKIHILITGAIISFLHAHIVKGFSFLLMLFLFAMMLRGGSGLQGNLLHDFGFLTRGQHAYILNPIIIIILIHCIPLRGGSMRAFRISCAAGNVTGRVALLLGCAAHLVNLVADLLHPRLLDLLHVLASLRAACAVGGCLKVVILAHEGVRLHEDIHNLLRQVVI